MARRRAAVISHAPGLSGIPWTGHFSRATRRLSWTTSSAMSKLPMRRTMAPVSLAASSRKTAVSAASVAARVSVRTSSFHSRPHLDRAGRPGLGHLEGFVEVFDLHDREPADDLFRLDERAVGDDPLAVAGADRGDSLRTLQLLAADDLAGLAVLLEPALRRLHTGRHLLRRHGVEALLVFHRPDLKQHVFHVTPPSKTTNAGLGNRQPQDPVYSGSCLLRNDMMPIAASVVRAARAKFSDSMFSASSRRRSYPRRTESLIMAMATVAALASLPASSPTVASSSSGPTALSTHPTASASLAERRVDSIRKRRARALPMRRGRRCV